MAEVYITEIPGGERQAWQCPYCSRMYVTRDEEGRELECPANCRRCGSPMDVGKAQAFQDMKAAESASKPIKRDTVRV